MIISGPSKDWKKQAIAYLQRDDVDVVGVTYGAGGIPWACFIHAVQRDARKTIDGELTSPMLEKPKPMPMRRTISVDHSVSDGGIRIEGETRTDIAVRGAVLLTAEEAELVHPHGWTRDEMPISTEEETGVPLYRVWRK